MHSYRIVARTTDGLHRQAQLDGGAPAPAASGYDGTGSSVGRCGVSDVVRKAVLAVAFVAALVIAFAALRLMRPSSGQTTTPAERSPASTAETTPLPAARAVAPTPTIAPTDPGPLPDVLIDPAVIVHKSLRQLVVVSDGRVVKHYRIALGHAPVGHKQHEGDNRTPEGSYYVCTKNAGSKFHRSLGLSYPNESDADAALVSGLITRRDHRAIVSAMRKMAAPPWKTPLGGEIMIHGSGSGRGDWTQGCIALDDDDAEELFTALPMGTPVTIEP